jgi:hypothetical protein
LEILQNAEEALFPSLFVFGLDRRERTGNAPPTVGDCALLLVAILRLPDALRDFSADLCHGHGNSGAGLDAGQGSFRETR